MSFTYTLSWYSHMHLVDHACAYSSQHWKSKEGEGKKNIVFPSRINIRLIIVKKIISKFKEHSSVIISFPNGHSLLYCNLYKSKVSVWQPIIIPIVQVSVQLIRDEKHICRMTKLILIFLQGKCLQIFQAISLMFASFFPILCF